jgi:hypothetical protein
MGTKVERIERYLRGVAAPTCVSERHRQQLRRLILGEIGDRRTVGVPGAIRQIAVAGVMLVCLGGAVGTFISLRQGTAEGRAGDRELPVRADAQHGQTLSTATADFNGVMELLQTAREPGQQPKLLPEQADVEVVLAGTDDHLPARMIEVATSARSDRPVQYAVTRGRKNAAGTGSFSPRPPSLSQADWAELSQLCQAGKGENLGTQEQPWMGRACVFQCERYTLRNGTRVIVSVGVPKEAQPK